MRNQHYHFRRFACLCFLLCLGFIPSQVNAITISADYTYSKNSTSNTPYGVYLLWYHTPKIHLSGAPLGSSYTARYYINGSQASGSISYAGTPYTGSWSEKTTYILNNESIVRGGAPTPYSKTYTYRADLIDNATGLVVDTNTLEYTFSGNAIDGGLTGIGSLKSIYDPLLDFYLSTQPLIDFPDGRPNDQSAPEPTPEELALRKKIEDVIEKGAISLPYAPQDKNFPEGVTEMDIEVVMGTADGGTKSTTLTVKKGENYLWEVPVDSDWDGTFGVKPTDDAWAQEHILPIDTLIETSDGNFTYSDEQQSSSDSFGTFTYVKDDGGGYVVISYNNEDDQGNITEQLVTVSKDTGKTVMVNGENVENSELEPTATNNGDWDEAALGSAVGAIESAGTGSAAASDAEALGQADADLINEGKLAAEDKIKDFTSKAPISSTGLPRLTSYPVNIQLPMGAAINDNINLGGQPFTAIRAVSLAAFTLYLFSSFWKKLHI